MKAEEIANKLMFDLALGELHYKTVLAAIREARNTIVEQIATAIEHSADSPTWCNACDSTASDCGCKVPVYRREKFILASVVRETFRQQEEVNG